MTDVPNHEFRIDLDGVVIGLECETKQVAEGFVRWFGCPSATGEPHIRLAFSLVSHDDTPRFPNSLVQTKTLGPAGSFDIADGLISGSYDPASGRGTLRAKAILGHGRLMRILEQVFYQAFHSARQIAGKKSFLVHSAGVIAGGLGFLFVGPSESGKTTVARHSAARHVLGDEMNLVIPDPDGYQVAGTLFNGTFREKRPGRAPLAGVFLLAQATHHRLVPVPPAEAVSALATEIVPPIGLDQVPTADTVPAMVDTAVQLLENIELKVLEFRSDPEFWEVITDHFGLPSENGDGRN
jgi:hypothetical protein